MSHFIPKKTLTESMASNPLDAVQTVDNDITKKAQEGILTAVAAETDAINQYIQILDLVKHSEPWLVKAATPVIEDIVSEEKKHLGQLTEFVSKLPAFEKEMEAGEEETETGEHKEEAVEESVNEKADEPFGKFDAEIIFDLLENKYHINITEDFVMDHRSELYPDEVDDMLAELQIDPNILPDIENDIINNADVAKNLKNKQDQEKAEALEEDIRTLKRLVDTDDELCLRSPDVQERIYKLINELTHPDLNPENI